MADPTAPQMPPPRATYDKAYAAETRVPAIYAVSIAAAALSTIFLFARFYCRAFVLRAWRVDDSILVVVWTLFIVTSVLNCLFPGYGVGRHPGSLSGPEDTNTIAAMGFANQVLYQMIMALAKTALCIFYLYIFQDKKSKRLVYVLLAFIVVGFVSVEAATIFRCRPIHVAWTPLDKGVCGDSTAVYYGSTIYNIVGDVLLMIFVVPRFLKLQISMRQKVILCGIVSLGILVIASSIVRLLTVLSFVKNFMEISWLFADVIIWSSIEMAACIICTSAPVLRPLARKIFPWITTRSSSNATSATRPSWPRTGNSSKPGRPNVGRHDHVELRSTSKVELTSQSDISTPSSEIKVKTEVNVWDNMSPTRREDV